MPVVWHLRFGVHRHRDRNVLEAQRFSYRASEWPGKNCENVFAEPKPRMIRADSVSQRIRIEYSVMKNYTIPMQIHKAQLSLPNDTLNLYSLLILGL